MPPRRPPRYRFFAPAHAARLKGLELTVRGVVEGVYAGMHKSPHRGFSIEFAEHREYVPGDEIKHLDWTILARTDRHYVKQYEQETNLRGTICLDSSGSMGWRHTEETSTSSEASKTPGNVTKFEYAAVLAASLAYLLSAQQDLAGLTLFDDAIRLQIPPGNGPSHLDQLFRKLEEAKPGNETDLAASLHQLATRIPRRGLVILISDLLDDPEKIIVALQRLKHARHQLVVVQTLDPAEIDLPFGKPVTFEDMENHARLQIDPKAIRTAYRQEIQNFLDTLNRRCGQFNIDYLLARTDVPWETQIRTLLRILSR
jgi:uncharacterized protein (DUF58 family)